MPEKQGDRLAKANATLMRSFLDRAGGDPIKAEELRREFYADLGRRSGRSRRRRRAKRRAEELRQLRAQGVEFVTEEELLRMLRAQVKR